MLDKQIEQIKDKGPVLLLATVGLLIGGWFLVSRNASNSQTSISQLVANTASSSSQTSSSDTPKAVSKDEDSPAQIMVDVKGAVHQPGLYELKSSSRVADAIKAAGGMTEAASPKSVNLAQKLQDEAIVYVATAEEEISAIPEAPTGQTASGSPSSTQTGTEPINLNTASLQDFQTIPGIGQKRAQDIIAYRDSQGGFQSVDELTNVSGIGDKTLEKLRNYVTVD